MKWETATVLHVQNDRRGQGWGLQKWIRRGDLRGSVGKDSAGVGDKLDVEGEEETRK